MFAANTLELTVNMSVEKELRELGDQRAEQTKGWSDYLSRIDNDSEPVLMESLVDLPKGLLIPCQPNGEPADLAKLIEYVYGQQPPYMCEQPVPTSTHEDHTAYSRRLR